MDASKARTLYFVVLLAVAVALPYFFLQEPPTATPAAAAPSAQKAAQPAAKEAPAVTGNPAQERQRFATQRLARIETPDLTATLGSYNGGLTSLKLKGKRYEREGKSLDLVTTSLPSFLPLAIELDGLPEAGAEDWDLEQLSPRAVVLRRDAAGLSVHRKVEAGRGAYQLWLTTKVTNRDTAPRKIRLQVATHHYVTRDEEGANIPLLPVQSWAISYGLCRHDDELERSDRSALLTPQRYTDQIAFTGVDNGYFLSAVAPDSGSAERCSIEALDRAERASDAPLGSVLSARLIYREQTLAPGASETYRTLAYIGPKSPEALTAAGHLLKETIASGWFTTLAEGLTWLLSKIHGVVGNWGWAIIFLTLIVKIVLFPLTAKQMQSMARMKELKPEMDRITELYGDDREKKGAAVMELYRKRGINPMAGCFPVLLQLPIWFSLYASLSSNVELFQAPFALWWTDLSTPDPFFILPLALGVLMFVQQKMSPAAGMDPMQQKMMLYMMPTMMTAFMLFLPSGLCLYMFTNSALSIGQQRLIEARLKVEEPSIAEPVEKLGDETTPTISPGREQKSIRPSKAERRLRRDKR